MGVTHLVLIGTLGVAGALAPPSSLGSQPPGDNPRLVAPGKDPYANVFTALQEYKSKQELLKALRSPRLRIDGQPRIVCGMVVVPVKPDADAKMVAKPKQDKSVDYKIRAIAPRVCNE